MRKNLKVILSSSGVQTQDSQTGQILGTGRKVGRLFELASLHLPQNCVSAATTTKTSIHQWHLLLGHALAKIIQPLISHDYLDLLKLSHLSVYIVSLQNNLPYLFRKMILIQIVLLA